MKTRTHFSVVDVVLLVILLAVPITSTEIMSYLEKGSAFGNNESAWLHSFKYDLRTSSVKTHCYNIPYNREQLKKIEKDGGDARAELNRLLQEKTEDEDLTKIVALPKIIFGDDSSMICLDFMDSYKQQQTEIVTTQFSERRGWFFVFVFIS